jgi:hypothetical protein
MSILPKYQSALDVEDSVARAEQIRTMIDQAGDDALAPCLFLALIKCHALADIESAALQTFHELLQTHPQRGGILHEIALVAGVENLDSDSPVDPSQNPSLLKSLFLPEPPNATPFILTNLLFPLRPLEKSFRRAGSKEYQFSEALSDLVITWLETTDEKTKEEVHAKFLIQAIKLFADHERSAGAEKLATLASRRISSSVPLKVIAAEQAAQNETWEACRDFAQVALQAEPENKVAGNWLALAQLAMGEKESAAGLWKEHSLQHTALYLSLLSVVLNEYDPDGPSVLAEEWLDVDFDETNSGAIQVPKNLVKAIVQLEAQLQSDPESEAADKLVEGLEMVEVSDPKNGDEIARFYLLRGYLMLVKNEIASAFEDLKIAIRFSPADPYVLSVMGQILRLLGRPKEAISCLRQIRPDGPDDFHAYFFLGLSYVDAGDRTKALSSLQYGFNNYFYDNIDLMFRPLMKRVFPDLAV